MKMVHPILMIPGPTNLSDDVLKALCQPMIGHTSQEFYEEFKEAHLLTSKLFGSDPERTVLFSGSGLSVWKPFFLALQSPGIRFYR
jgi:aspartate aminotransferase-like enzyme